MGWSQKRKPSGISVVEFIRDHTTMLKWTPGPLAYTVLAMQMVHSDTVYAAVEKKSVDTREVFAVVFEVREYPGEHYNLELHDQDEEQWPNRIACPKRILDLLTPTDCVNSNEWRDACRVTIRNAVGLAPKTRIEVLGYEFDVVHCHGGKGADVTEVKTGKAYRLTPLQMNLARVVDTLPAPTVSQPVLVVEAYVEEDEEDADAEVMAL